MISTRILSKQWLIVRQPRRIRGIRISEFFVHVARVSKLLAKRCHHGSETVKAGWVIDILKDIRQFSEKNGMVELAEQLDDAIFVAAHEIGAQLDSSGTIDVGQRNSRSAARAVAEHEVH